MSTNYNKNNFCDCFKGTGRYTPVTIENIPGLTALSYRVGTHSSFKNSMLSSISTKPILNYLKTRENDDHSIALIDGWSTVLDVLTFYQERIANEGYMRTARERRSVLELTNHIGYRPGAGVAATTYLAFMIDEMEGSPTKAKIPTGTKVQSIPEQDEFPQIFETIEEIDARVEWNAIRPRMEEPQKISDDTKSIVLKGVDTGLKRGDMIMTVIGDKKNIKKIIDLDIKEDLKTTTITLKETGSKNSSNTMNLAIREEESFVDPVKKTLDTYTVNEIIQKTWKKKDLSALAWMNFWSTKELLIRIKNQNIKRNLETNASVYVFRKSAPVFGYNAPEQITCNIDTKTPNPPAEWQEWTLKENPGKIYLDSAYEDILTDTYALVKKPDKSFNDSNVYIIKDSNICSRSEYGIKTKTTEILLDNTNKWWDSKRKMDDLLSIIRDYTIYIQSEELETAPAPKTECIGSNSIEIDGTDLDLYIGQRIIISGVECDENDINSEGIMKHELNEIEDLVNVKGYNVIKLKNSLANTYKRDTVSINANVAIATHGETKTEILGSGDGSQIFQKFELKQNPLTYISSSSGNGSISTLEIRVNDILWKEVPTFYGISSDEQVYITDIADDGTVTVQFGDGITGARLPSGVENVIAKYRVGTGLEGHLNEEQLTLLLTPQLGVKGVSNPLKPSGAEDPEAIENLRRNAPLTVLTFDRIVSLSDFEDYTRAFNGIGKARADLLWDGKKQAVHITIASADGDRIESNSTLFNNLSEAIEKASHINHTIIINSFNPIFFDIKVKVLVDNNFIYESVIKEVQEKLILTFSFGKRDFGQDTTPSEIISIVQGVEGIIAAHIKEINGLDPYAVEHFRIISNSARLIGDKIEAAELLMINPDGIEIEEMES